MALPSRYTQLRYIQSSGTQWIDTGFVPTAKTKIEFDFEYTDLTAQYSGLFVSGSWFMYGINGNHEIYLGTQYAIGDTATKDRTLVTIDGVNKVATIGNKSYSFSEASFTKPSVTLPIFVLNDGSAKRNYCYMKLYSYKIYDDGTLIRNFVPALRHDSYGSLAGLYDLVNNVFYTNAGSGSFSYDLATGAVDGVGASIIDAASYGITEGKCMAGGTVYSINKGRTLVDGTGYDIAFSIPLSSLAEGTIVYLHESGRLKPFYVAKHNYEIGLNGAGRTLLVRKDCYTSRKWHTSDVNAYAESDIDAWLNGTYKNLLDAAIKTAIGTTTFYYTPGGGVSGNAIKVSTLSRSVFILSSIELGTSLYSNNGNAEGSALPIASTLRTGISGNQWTRSPYIRGTVYVYYSDPTNGSTSTSPTNSRGARPAFTLPSTIAVNPSDYSIIG